jgi:hypothetical protein
MTEVQELLGPDYNPHAGAAALHREAAFYRWCAVGNDPHAFAAWLAEGHADTETALEAER